MERRSEYLAGVTSTYTNTVNYQEDANGNTTSITNTVTTAPGNRSLSYDSESRVERVVRGDGLVVIQSYNPQGQRTSYSVTLQGQQTPAYTLRYRYQGSQLAQLTVSGSQQAPECQGGDTTGCTETFVYGPDGAPLELLYTSADSQGPCAATCRYFYEEDGHGNVVALTNSARYVVDQYQYDLWGVPTISEQVPQPFLYAGYVYDRELGWYWLSAREYDPALARFLQPDPSEQEGVQSYVYAGDDPLDAIDPTGLWCIAGAVGSSCGPNSLGSKVNGGLEVAGGVVLGVVSILPELLGPEAAPITAVGEEGAADLVVAGVAELAGTAAEDAATGAAQGLASTFWVQQW